MEAVSGHSQFLTEIDFLGLVCILVVRVSEVSQHLTVFHTAVLPVV